jgi:hypothetical protein
MQLVPTRQALKLTGLSGPTLREWTSRRALIPADIVPKKQGSPAQYSWQTILVLRIAVTLRDKFHLELQAHSSLFVDLRRGFGGKSFIALWDKAVALHGDDDWAFVEAGGEQLRQDAIIIRLNPHLFVLSESFALPKPVGMDGQLDLFPVSTVGHEVCEPAHHPRNVGAERRRRSA